MSFDTAKRADTNALPGRLYAWMGCGGHLIPDHATLSPHRGHSIAAHRPENAEHPLAYCSSSVSSPTPEAVHPIHSPLELHNDTVTGILGRTPDGDGTRGTTG